MAAPMSDAIEITIKSIIISKGNMLCDVGSNCQSIMILIMRAVITPIVVANTIFLSWSSVSILNARAKRTKGICKVVIMVMIGREPKKYTSNDNW